MISILILFIFILLSLNLFQGYEKFQSDIDIDKILIKYHKNIDVKEICNVPVFAICLKERLNNFENFLKKIKLYECTTIIKAIDKINNHLTTCSIAHLKLYELLTDGPNIIFEDDCILNNDVLGTDVLDVKEIINQFIKNYFKSKASILFLGFCGEHGSKIVGYIDKYPVYKLKSPRCLHSYIISKDTGKFIKDMVLKNNFKDPIDELIGKSIYNNEMTSYGINLFHQPWQLTTTDPTLINDFLI